MLEGGGGIIFEGGNGDGAVVKVCFGSTLS